MTTKDYPPKTTETEKEEIERQIKEQKESQKAMIKALIGLASDEKINEMCEAAGIRREDLEVSQNKEKEENNLPENKEPEKINKDEELRSEYYDKALEIITRTGDTTFGNLEKKLSISSKKAKRLLEMLEQDGILGPSIKGSPREILIKGLESEKNDLADKEKENIENTEEENSNEKEIKTVKDEVNDIFDAITTKEQAEILAHALKSSGLDGVNLASVPEWQTLSLGEKLLVAEQASQELLSKVKEIGEQKFREKNNIKFSYKPKDWRPLKLANKIKNNIIKAYWISQEEKNVIKDIEKGTISPTFEIVQNIIERTADMHLNVQEKNGRAVIVFMEQDNSLPENHKKLIEKYNKIANEYARMPDSWKNEKAAKSTDGFIKKNYKHFMEVEKKYDEITDELLKMNTKKYEYSGLSQERAEEKAMLEMRENDFSLAILQYINTNPDAISEINKIKKELSISRLLNNENIWRGIYIGAGYTARNISILASTLGVFAAPLIGGTIGGIRARRKAKEKINEAFNRGRGVETFKERKESGKSASFDNKNKDRSFISKAITGKSIEAKEVGAFIDADHQIEKIDNLLLKIDRAKTSIERAKFKDELSTRIDYIEDKHGDGLINYGTKNAIYLNYQLLKKLSYAETQLNALDLMDDKDVIAIRERRNNLLEVIMAKNEISLSDKQMKFSNEETARGILLGASFSILGWKIREWFNGDSESINEVIKNSNEVDTVSGADTGNVKPGASFEDNTNLNTENGTGAKIDNAVKHESVQATADNGQGAIPTIRELQNNLKLEYKDSLDNAPASVKHILETDPNKLAQEFGMYKPGEDAESLLIKSGSYFKVDSSGNLSFHDIDANNDIVLLKGNEIKVDSPIEGKMFDSDSPKIETEINNTSDENIISATDTEKELASTQVAPETIDANNSSLRVKTMEENIVDSNDSDLYVRPSEINIDILQPTELKELKENYLHSIFPTKKLMRSWENINDNMSAQKLIILSNNEKLDSAYEPLNLYVKKLQELSGLNPYSATELLPPESISDFIDRAYEKINQIGRLDEVKIEDNSKLESGIVDSETNNLTEILESTPSVHEANIDNLKDLKEITKSYESIPGQPPLKMIIENISGKELKSLVSEEVAETKTAAKMVSDFKMNNIMPSVKGITYRDYYFEKILPNGDVKLMHIRFYKDLKN